jgi:deoxycytidylate deaminase
MTLPTGLKDWALRHIQLDEEEAKQFTRCQRKGVGCSLWLPSENGIILWHRSVNGPPYAGSGLEFSCSNEVGNCGCVHAEERMILTMMKQDVSELRARNPIMLVSYSPCTRCANLIIETRIVMAVIWKTLTQHDQRGEERLRKAGISYHVDDLK